MQKYLLIMILLLFSNVHAKTKTPELNLEQVIGLVKERNHQVRSQMEKVFRARHRVILSMSHLLPSLNFNSMIDIIKFDYFDLVPTLVGFVFPSNWFRWEESKLYFQAERHNYAVLLANEINAVTSLVYRINCLKNIREIYRYHLQQVKKMIAAAEQGQREGKIAGDISLKFKSTLYKLNHDIKKISCEINHDLDELGEAIDYSGKLKLAPIPLPSLDQTQRMSRSQITPIALQNSMEIRAFEYLKLAAKYSKYRRTVEFLSPYGSRDSSLGFGYYSYIEISKSKQIELGIRQEEVIAQLKKAVSQTTSNYNTNTKLYKIGQQGLINDAGWDKVLIEKLRNGGKYESNEYVRVLKSEINFKSKINQAQHQHLIARAQIDRLTWQGVYFDLLNLSPKRKLRPLTKLKSQRIPGWLQKILRSSENSEIKRDIKRRRIILPQGVKNEKA